VPAARLGIGVISYAAVWHGVAEPRQSIATVTGELEYLSYRDLLGTLWTPEREQFDADAGAPYLSVDLDGRASDLFVSYEDEAACVRKMDYVRTNGLGGVILWDLAGGYLPDRPAGARTPLLSALGNAR
jgi:chitinase